jgi:hypothetical protein
MWPFNLFTRKNKSYDKPAKDKSIGEVLLEVAEYIPERYKGDRQFINFNEFIEHNEWGLALESLVELADESGHFFSDAFWMDIRNCASSMSMLSIADYCSAQILRNKSELGHLIPKGWTEEKISDTTFNTYIAEKIKNDWAAERRKKDDLISFITVNGFHIKSHGRAGTIYFIEDRKVLEIDFEISGVKQYDILIFYDIVCDWVLPNKTRVSEGQKAEIRERLVEWLKLKKIRAEL